MTSLPWRIVLLGRFGIQSQASGAVELFTFPQRHARQLLAYLALHRGKHSRRHLASVLWTDKADQPEKALASLRSTLAQLRKVHPGVDLALRADRESVWLDTALPCDVVLFEELLRKTGVGREEALAEAVTLYQGDLLPGWRYLVEEELPPLTTRRAQLRQRCADACAELMQLSQARGDAARAQFYARRALELLEPGSSPGWLQTARAVAPPPVFAVRPGSPHSLSVLGWVWNAPALIGRQAELDALQSWLQNPDAAPLFTLTGSGGIGKTRIAQAFAQTAAQEQQLRVVVFHICEWLQPETLLGDMAEALYPDGTGGKTALEAIRYFVGEDTRPTLFVLDAIEHLLPTSSDEPNPVAAQLRALLVTVPMLRVLATSLVPIGGDGEIVYRVRHLSLPPAHSTDVAAIAHSESVQLFVQTATRRKTPLHLNGSNAPTVAAICRALHGHPFGIRVAAAQFPVLRLAALREQVEKKQVPRQPRRPRSRSHRALDAMIEWAFRRLSPEEQTGYLSLTVFHSGFTKESVRAVCGEAVAAQLETWENDALIDAMATADGAPKRYHFLDTLHYFAEDNLAAAQMREFRRKHAHYFLAYAEAAAWRFRSPDAVSALQAIRTESVNLAWAIETLEETGDAERLARLVYALSVIMMSYSSLEALLKPRIRKLLAERDALTPATRARLLCAAARLAGSLPPVREREYLGEAVQAASAAREPLLLAEVYLLYAYYPAIPGDEDRAEEFAERGLHIARQENAVFWQSIAYHRLGNVARHRYRMEQCIAYYRESLRLADIGGSPMHRIVTLNALCAALSEAVFDQAASVDCEAMNREALWCGEEAYRLAQDIGFERACAHIMASLHSALWVIGDAETMHDHALRGLAHLRASGGEDTVAGQLQRMLGASYLLQRKWSLAAAALIQALDLHAEAEPVHLSRTALFVCHFAVHRDEPVDAADLFGYALALSPPAARYYERHLEADPLFRALLDRHGRSDWDLRVLIARSADSWNAIAAIRQYLVKIVEKFIGVSENHGSV